MPEITDKTILALDKKFHEDCFRCAHCKKPFPGGKHIPHKGKAFCRTDYERLCPKCDKVVVSGAAEFGGKRYHKDCLKCSLCRKAVGDEGDCYELDGKPFCKTDYDLEIRIAKKTGGGGGGAAKREPSLSSFSSSSSSSDSNTVTKALPTSTRSTASSSSSAPKVAFDLKEDRDEPSSSSSSSSSGPLPKCEYCGEPVEGRRMNFASKVYHDSCFKCSSCFTPIPADADFTQGKFGIVCLKCRSMECTVCKGVIPEGETPVEFYGDKMHAKCFKCSKCKCVLNPKESYEFRRKPYCLRDYSAARVAS